MKTAPVPVMYRMKPLFEQSGEMEVKSTMYGMKNLQNSCLLSDETSEIRKRGILIKEIEERQAFILKTLSEIRSQMSSLRAQLLQENISSTGSKGNHVGETKTELNLSELASCHEVVINAGVNYPPYSLLAIPRIWDLHLNITCHLHSSLKEFPHHFTFFKEHIPQTNPNKSPELNVRLVWKNVDTCEFVISPVKYLPIQGEVNILRFFQYCTSSTLDDASRTQMDCKLDLCHRLQYCKDKGEFQSFLKQLTENLNKSSWLFGKEISVVDIAAWSVLKRLNRSDVIPPVKKWFGEFEKIMGF